jgi:hypothetical protein
MVAAGVKISTWNVFLLRLRIDSNSENYWGFNYEEN